MELVKIGTTAAQKKLFFNLRKIKNRIRAVEDGDLSPQHVKKIADVLSVSQEDVISMNRRLSNSDSSLNAPIGGGDDFTGEWQDMLVDKTMDQETLLVEQEELSGRRELLNEAMEVLTERERNILFERRFERE